MVKKLVKLATENAHVNQMDIPVTSEQDPKSPANQRGLAIRRFGNMSEELHVLSWLLGY